MPIRTGRCFSIAILCAATVFTCSAGVVRGTDKEDEARKERLEILRDAARELRKAREAEREKQRFVLVQRALELAAEEKRIAAKKLDEANQQRARLAYINEVRNWALGDFEAAERNRLPKTDKMNRRYDRWRNSRQQFRRMFLEFPHRSRGAVKSGRALNFFLEACGGFAMDHQVTMERIRDTLRVLEAERSRGAPPKRSAQLNDKIDELRQLLTMLESIGGKRPLTKFVRERIRFQRGDADTQLIIDAKQGALPLNWPAVLQTKSKYAPHRMALENAKAKALEELGAGVGISIETQREMLYAAEQIASKFRRDWLDYAVPPKDAITFTRYVRTKQFVRGLRTGVLRFIEASEVADVQPLKPFEGRTVAELLTFMSENGFRFAPSDINSEDAYKVVYKQLVDYYTDIHGLRIASEKGELEEQRWNEHADKYVETISRDTMQGLENAMKARPPQHLTEILADFSDIIANVSVAINSFD